MLERSLYEKVVIVQICNTKIGLEIEIQFSIFWEW